MGAVPEPDPRLGKDVRDRHHSGTDDAKRMLDAVTLERFDKGFFGGHLHVRRSLWGNVANPVRGNLRRRAVRG
jgi:hypothetical protein